MAHIATLTTSPIADSHYGKACTNCSKAKCKCTYTDGRLICERCDRLKKQCIPLTPARKKTTRTTSTVAKQQRIEQKLDSLVSLLQAQGQPATADALQLSAKGIEPSGQSGWPITEPNSSTPTASTVSVPTPSTAATSPAHSQYYPDPWTPEQTLRNEKALVRFRDESLLYFPFIYFPAHLTARQLSQDYPLLWLSISAMAATSMTHLCSLSERLQKAVLDKIYVQGERSMDTLLAILSFVGWFRHQRRQKPFFNMWTQMATSLAVELGLSKFTPEEPAFFCHLTIWPHNKPKAKRERTMLERRAILAAYVMSSCVSNSFRKSDPLRWTPFMGECLNVLETQSEWEGDQVLAFQVRCQLVVDQISESPWLGGILDDGGKKGAPEYFSKSIDLQLQQAKSKIGLLAPRQKDTLRLYLLSVELTMHEASQELPLTANTDAVTQHKKLSPFYNALNTIKAWFDVFFTISSDKYPDLTFSLFCQFIHCIVSLYRLSTLDDPIWDREYVKQTVDVMQVIERFASNIESFKHSRTLVMDNEEEDLFTKSAGMMRRLAEAWGAEIAATGAAKEQAVGELEIPPELMDLDVFDNEWLADMFLSWEH